MPPKTPRPPGIDDWVAARVRHEREQRGWSTSELARRVSLAGVTLRQQQVWQVESGKPPRRLSVGEAAAFARVFGISVADLMTPPPSEDTRGLAGLIEVARAFMEWRRDAGVLAARFQDIAKRVGELGPEEVYTATVVEKYSGLSEVSGRATRNLEEIAKQYSAIAESIKDHGSVWSVIASLRDQIADDTMQPVVAVVVTSGNAVLAGRRVDGQPPWTFIAGEIEPGEQPEDAAVREVKEETGCEIRAGQVIGERVHPATGRRLIYMAASPVRGTKVFVGDERELAEVRWLNLTEALDLMPDMFPVARDYLERELGGRS